MVNNSLVINYNKRQDSMAKIPCGMVFLLLLVLFLLIAMSVYSWDSSFRLLLLIYFTAARILLGFFSAQMIKPRETNPMA